MTIQPSRHESLHCTLEPVPTEEMVSNYTYSVPDNSSPYSVDMAHYHDENATAIVPTAPALHKPQKQSSRRWLLLLLYGLILASSAGVIGGLIGKVISDNKHKNDATSQQGLEPSSCPTTTSSNASTPTSTSDSPVSESIFQRTIAVPTTGCAPDNNFLKAFPYSFSQNSTYLKTTYNTFCDAGWNRDELFAVSTASTSDCIEACVMYNGYRKDGDRWCVGGGFVPDWWNQSKAMDESGGMSYNCFLKSNGSGIAKNDRVQEVVSLCLFGNGPYCADTLIE